MNLKIVNFNDISFIPLLAITMWPSENCRSLNTAKSLRINIKNAIENVTHCFNLNGRESPSHYSTIVDTFCDVYLWFIKVLHFRRPAM